MFMVAVCDAMTPTQERAIEAEHPIGEHGGNRRSDEFQDANSNLDKAKKQCRVSHRPHCMSEKVGGTLERGAKNGHFWTLRP
jgi:hypothetical protein